MVKVVGNIMVVSFKERGSGYGCREYHGYKV